MAAVFNLGGGEIVLIGALLLFLALVVGVLGLIYLILWTVLNRRVASPSTLPPEQAVQEQQRKDREHIQLLAVFHFVFAGLALLGVGFLCVHYAVMHTMFSDPTMWKGQHGEPPPKALLDAFNWFYLFFGLVMLAFLALNILSGLFLLNKTHRVFSFVVAGMDCLQIPFGTALGVFTIVVLSRDSVRQLYAEPGAPPVQA